MISVAIGPPVKLCVAATPEYFARYGKPRHPHDLLNHQCVVFVIPAANLSTGNLQRSWKLLSQEISFWIVDAELEAVLMGAGIGYLLYEQIKEYLDTGRLECVLEDWSTERPGFQIYYPNRQYMSCGLRAFLDYVKRVRSARVSVTDHNNYLLFALRASSGNISPNPTSTNGVATFSANWKVHSAVKASIFGKIPVKQAKAVKAKHQIPTVIARGLLRIKTYSGFIFLRQANDCNKCNKYP